jgi:hypothetical protein
VEQQLAKCLFKPADLLPQQQVGAIDPAFVAPSCSDDVGSSGARGHAASIVAPGRDVNHI